MASLKEHCADCMQKLGKDYFHVHVWLDAYAAQEHYDIAHRVHRHHLDGVKQIIGQWGEEAGKAAYIHIEKDMGKVMKKYEVAKLYKPYVRDVRTTSMNLPL